MKMTDALAMEKAVAVGERVFLRPMEEADCPLIVRWRNQDSLRQFYVYREPFTMEGQLQYYKNKVLTGAVFHYMICEKESTDPIGCLIFTDFEPEQNTIEYGLFIGETTHAGQGIGTDAIRTGMKYAFRHFGVASVTARIMTHNMPSLRSNEKAGFYQKELIPGVICSDGESVEMVKVEARPDTVAASGKI